MFTNDFKANAYLNITKLPSFCFGVVGRIKLDNSEVVPWYWISPIRDHKAAAKPDSTSDLIDSEDQLEEFSDVDIDGL